MNILIIYDTVYGNTKKVAVTMLKTLKKQKSFNVRCKQINRTRLNDLYGADLVLVGGPTHKWGLSEGMKQFFTGIRNQRFSNKGAVAFCTKLHKTLAGSAAVKMNKFLQLLGFDIAAKPFDVYVDAQKGPLQLGELHRVEEFAKFVWVF